MFSCENRGVTSRAHCHFSSVETGDSAAFDADKMRMLTILQVSFSCCANLEAPNVVTEVGARSMRIPGQTDR